MTIFDSCLTIFNYFDKRVQDVTENNLEEFGRLLENYEVSHAFVPPMGREDGKGIGEPVWNVLYNHKDDAAVAYLATSLLANRGADSRQIGHYIECLIDRMVKDYED